MNPGLFAVCGREPGLRHSVALKAKAGLLKP
jgi:hypothetical protein